MNTPRRKLWTHLAVLAVLAGCGGRTYQVERPPPAPAIPIVVEEPEHQPEEQPAQPVPAPDRSHVNPYARALAEQRQQQQPEPVEQPRSTITGLRPVTPFRDLYRLRTPPQEPPRNKPDPADEKKAADKVYMARKLEKDNKPRLAAKLYQEVIDNWPGTKAAETARSRIVSVR